MSAPVRLDALYRGRGRQVMEVPCMYTLSQAGVTGDGSALCAVSGRATGDGTALCAVSDRVTGDGTVLCAVSVRATGDGTVLCAVPDRGDR